MKQLLEKISKLKVLVIGDIILDHYIWGDAWRISPEAPVPVVGVENDTYTAGGAANVALNINSMGARSELCGVIGQDSAGENLLKIFKEHSVHFNEHFIMPNKLSILKTRVIVRGQQLCRLDREESAKYYNIYNEKSIKLIEEKLDEYDAVIISDYAKGVVSNELIEKIHSLSLGKNVFTALDPKPSRKLKHNGIGLLTPNKKESFELCGLSAEDYESYPAEEICSLIWEKYKPRNLVITLGSEGMLISKEGKVLKIIPTYAQEVFDVSGAGDTVISALTIALTAEATMEEAAHFANIAAGVVVGKIGTATVSPKEILQYEQNHE